MKFNNLTKIAVLGVSHNPEKYGYRIFKDLLKNNYDAVGINPKEGEVEGKKLFTSLSELPFKPELVIFVVPAKIGVTILDEIKKLEINDIWLQPGAESDDLVELAQKMGLNTTYDKCFMTDQGIW